MPSAALPGNNKTPGNRGSCLKRMKGFEPSTFAMARRRSSQLSYIREVPPFYPAVGVRAHTWLARGRSAGADLVDGQVARFKAAPRGA